MKSLTLRLWAPTVAVLLLCGCASVPKKLSDQESLVVIPSDSVSEPGHEFSYSYRLQFSNHQVKVPLSKGHNVLTLVVLRQPEVSVIGLEASGNGPIVPLDLALPYEPGTVVIAYDGLRRRTEKVGKDAFVDRISSRKLTDQERSDLLEKLRADNAYAAWFPLKE